MKGTVVNVCTESSHNNLLGESQDLSITHNISRYNAIRNGLGSSFSSMNYRFEKVQKILTDCTKICQDFESLYDNTSLVNDIMLFKKELGNYRIKLMDEQVQIINNKQVMIKSLKGFDKIWSDYSHFERELALQKDEISKLKINFDKQIEENELELATHVKEMNEKKQELEKKYETEIEKRVEELEKEKQKLEDGKSLVQQKLQLIDPEQKALSLEKQKIEDEKLIQHELGKTVRNLKSIYDIHFKKFNSDTLSYQKNLSIFEERNRMLLAENEMLKKEKEFFLNDRNAFEEQKKKLNEEVETHQSTLASYRRQNELLSRKCKTMEDDLDNYNQELVASHKTIRELRKKSVASNKNNVS